MATEEDPSLVTKLQIEDNFTKLKSLLDCICTD